MSKRWEMKPGKFFGKFVKNPCPNKPLVQPRPQKRRKGGICTKNLFYSASGVFSGCPSSVIFDERSGCQVHDTIEL